MAVDAKLVMQLRAETGAPVSDCKSALEEANGDFERAKEILREKGKAAAAKRQDRSTSEGVVALSVHHDHKSIGAAVLECETDFVANNEDFVNLANHIAEMALHTNPGSDPRSLKSGDHTVGEMIDDAIGKIRENIKLSKALQLKTEYSFATYVHHDKKQAAIVEIEGDPEVSHQIARDIAIQSVAMPAEFLTKEEIPQDYVDKQLEIETKRAIEEGKAPEVAKNVAQGRVNKEIFKQVVLMEQPYFRDQSKTVGQFVKEESKNVPVRVVSITRLKVGEE